jgi:solute:Na+ symporter, SSS family
MEQAQQVFAPVDWLVIVAYMGMMVAIGVLSSRKQEDANTFFLGGRAMPAWAVTLSVLATTLSAATFIGAPQIAYGGDLTYLILNIGTMLAAFVVAFVLIPPVYKAGTVTIYGYLGKRYGEPAMVAASIMFLLGRLLASGARLFIAAIAFALMLYGDTSPRELILAILILGVIGTVYTAFGGIKAVIWTDTIQIAVVVFAAGLSIFLLLKAIPLPFAAIIEVLRNSPDGDKLRIVDLHHDWSINYTIWTGIIASTFVSTACYGTDYDIAQRMMTAKSPLQGGLAVIASCLLGIPVVCLFLFIGLLLSIYYGRPDLMGAAAPLDVITGTERVYPQFLLNHLPVGLRGVAMAGMFAAAMSSFDSAINAMAGTAVADLYMPWRRRQSGSEEIRSGSALAAPRFAVVFMGFLLTAFAVLAAFLHAQGGQGLVDFALGVMAFALAPLLGVFMAAILTPRGNSASAIAALILGAEAVLLLQPYMLQRWFDFALGWPWIWVVAAPISFGVCVIGAPAGIEKKKTPA